jgi:hypothetical protein
LIPAALSLAAGGGNWVVGITTNGLLTTSPTSTPGQAAFNFGSLLLSVNGAGLLQTTEVPCANNGVILQDDNLGYWLMQISEAGYLQTMPSSGGVPATIVLAAPSGASSWLLGITTGGFLTTKKVVLPGAPAFAMASSCCDFGFQVRVTDDGLLTTTQLAQWDSGLIAGALYPQNAAYPTPWQPMGVGTPVANIQQAINREIGFPGFVEFMNEFTGRFFPGCGHSIMMWDLKEQSVCGVQSCLVCCPVCLYIQQVIMPYSLILDPSMGPFAYIVG